jgi:tetratricopeptide (TPR) repeat protein
MKKPERDLTIVGDFLRYCCFLFGPFCIIGIIFSLMNGFSFTALVINPLIYSVGISLIIIVISYDINAILDLVGLGKNPLLSLHITYSKEIQEIGILMGAMNYSSALKKVDTLLGKEPDFAMAHNLRGEILLDGYQKSEEARDCFNRALELSKPEEEQHRIAKSLKASTYGAI